MIRNLFLTLGLLAGLAACVPAGNNGFSPGVTDIAAQRVRFAAEAVCFNNRSRSAQIRAAVALNFPVTEREGAARVYINPGTLTFVRIGPAPPQRFTDTSGKPRVSQGNGCSVGSPAVGTERANRLAGEILTPRLVDGSDQLLAPLGAGTNAEGGAGFFFERLSVTLPVARTTFSDPQTGEAFAFDHPVILVIHN